MLDKIIRIATRQSPLALWQAHYVQQRLMACHPGLQVELVPMVTRGDVILDTPLAKVGGKGLFVKELELALLEGRADIAVHSMKDVPVDFLPAWFDHHLRTRRSARRFCFQPFRLARSAAAGQRGRHFQPAPPVPAA